MTWALNWFYFGHCKCLVDGGTFGTVPSTNNNLILKLAAMIDDKAAGPTALRQIFDYSARQQLPNGEPRFIKAVRDVIKPDSWPRTFPLMVNFRKWPDQGGTILPNDYQYEILLGPGALTIPWPFRVTGGQVGDAFQRLEKWVEANCQIPNLADGEYRPGRDLRLHSLMMVVEDLVKAAVDGYTNAKKHAAASHVLQKILRAGNPVARWAAVAGYASSVHIENRFWEEFEVPISGDPGPPTDVVIYPNMYLHESGFSVEPDGSLRLHLGQLYEPKFHALLEPWPCGYFTAKTLSANRATKGRP